MLQLLSNLEEINVYPYDIPRELQEIRNKLN